MVVGTQARFRGSRIRIYSSGLLVPSKGSFLGCQVPATCVRVPSSEHMLQDSGSKFPDPGVRVTDSAFLIQAYESRVHASVSQIPDLFLRIAGYSYSFAIPGSGTRLPCSAFTITGYEFNASRFSVTGFRLPGSGSKVAHPRYMLSDSPYVLPVSGLQVPGKRV